MRSPCALRNSRVPSAATLLVALGIGIIVLSGPSPVKGPSDAIRSAIEFYRSAGKLSDPGMEGGPTPPHPALDDDLLAWLTQLPPLQKVHYSWSLPPALYEDGVPPELYEYVRITHAATTNAFWANQALTEPLVELCAQVNATDP